MLRCLLTCGVVAIVLATAAPDGAAAQLADDTLRARFRLPAPPTTEISARGTRVAPGATLVIPSAFGADFGDAFAGVGFQAFTRAEDHPDGGFVAGFGLGSARRAVGLEVALTSFGTVRTCCRGGASFKVHRLLPRYTSVAIGLENGLTWGSLHGSDVATDAGSSIYGVATKVFHARRTRADPFGTVTVTVGAGNGRFRREQDIIEHRERINPFGGVAVRVLEPVAVMANWTGQDLAAGASIVPFRYVPLFISPGVADLTTQPRMIFGIGYGFNYGGWF